MKLNSPLRHLTKTTRFILIGMFVVLMGFPVYWLVITSFKPETKVATYPPEVLPITFQLSNYVELFTHRSIYVPRYFINSGIIAFATTLVVIYFSTLGAYSLARIRFAGRKTLSRLILFTYIVPKVLLIVPIFVIIHNYRLTDTYWSLIISYTAFCLPFCLWILKGFFQGIPVELEEAAQVDGCGRLGALFRVVLPVAAPGVVAAAMFTFVLAWNEFLFAVIFINSETKRTLPLVMAYISDTGDTGVVWSQLMALAVLTTVPVFIVFFALQKYLVRGLAAGAVKG